METDLPNANIVSAKKELRKRMRGLASALTVEDRQRQSLAISALIRESRWFSRARAVLLYAPLPDEPDLSQLVDCCLEAGVVVGLPRYNPVSKEYDASRILQPLPHLPKGRFNIPEPGPDASAIDWNLLDFVAVPGLAFGRDCHRLGRGMGFYDRLLAKARGILCGVAFQHQVMEVVPVEAHDVPLDLVAAPPGWIVSARLGARR